MNRAQNLQTSEATAADNAQYKTGPSREQTLILCVCFYGDCLFEFNIGLDYSVNVLALSNSFTNTVIYI